jgi:hypothetical protein
MLHRNSELPRYWPILFVLDCAGTLRNNFHLQKILYLAQVEHHVPMEYKFSLETYGPYSRAIKADFISLASEGLINLDYWTGWVFAITDKGRERMRAIFAQLDETHLKAFRDCIERWRRKGLRELMRYVYEKHLPTDEAYLQLKAECLDLASTLMNHIAEYPTSSNRLLLTGILDYVDAALNKEQLVDPVHRNHFVRAAVDLVDDVSTLYDETNLRPELLKELGLGSLRGGFEHFQQVCEQYGILPSLYDEKADLAALIS